MKLNGWFQPASLAVSFAMFAVLFLIFCAFAITAHCSTTVPNRPNSLGVEQYYSNPNVYLFAVPIDGAILQGARDEKYTSIRFQPYNTMSLYDESVLFCGDVSVEFNHKRGPLVITYDRVAHRALQGIGCHELDSVFVVPTPEEGQ